LLSLKLSLKVTSVVSIIDNSELSIYVAEHANALVSDRKQRILQTFILHIFCLLLIF